MHVNCPADTTRQYYTMCPITTSDILYFSCLLVVRDALAFGHSNFVLSNGQKISLFCLYFISN